MGVRDVVGKVNRVEKSGKNLRDIGYDPFLVELNFITVVLMLERSFLFILFLSLSHLRICCNICQTKG